MGTERAAVEGTQQISASSLLWLEIVEYAPHLRFYLFISDG